MFGFYAWINCIKYLYNCTFPAILSDIITAFLFFLLHMQDYIFDIFSINFCWSIPYQINHDKSIARSLTEKYVIRISNRNDLLDYSNYTICKSVLSILEHFNLSILRRFAIVAYYYYLLLFALCANALD